MVDLVPEEQGPSPRRRVRKRHLVLLLVLALLALGLVMVLQALTAYRELRSAERRASDIGRLLIRGEHEPLAVAAQSIESDTTQAREALSGPQWSLAQGLPWIGSDVKALRTITEVADALALQALPPLVEAGTTVGSADLQRADGGIDLGPIARATPLFVEADRAAQRERRAAAAIDLSDLTGPVRRLTLGVTATTRRLSTSTSAVVRTVDLLPGILGFEGTRRYLVAVQNNSEPRALGGITGSLIALEATDGRLDLVRQRSAGSFSSATRPVIDLSRAERDLYGTQLGTFVQNVTGTPDFRRTARLIRAHWARSYDARIDGVAAIDPVALDGLLLATGRVKAPFDRIVRPGTAAPLLLNETYLKIADPAIQDAFFAGTASAIFERATAGDLDVPRAAAALIAATEQGRFLFSSARQPERGDLSGTALTGPLAGAEPTIGVFLHDRTQSKMGYYERLRARAYPSCDDGSVEVSVKVTSTAPRGRGSLPAAVTGMGAVAPRGHIASQVYLYAPRGARITSFVSDRGPRRASLHRHLGRVVASWPAELAPGQSVRLRYRLEGVDDPQQDLALHVTPGPGPGLFKAVVVPCGT